MQEINSSIRKFSLVSNSDKTAAAIGIPIFSIMFLGMATMPILLFMSGSVTPDEYTGFIPLVILLLFLVWMIFFVLTSLKQYIEIHDDGIYCLGSDYQLYTPWSNVAGLGWKKLSTNILNTVELKEAPSREITISEGRMQRRAVVARRRWLPIEPRHTLSFPLGSVTSPAWRDGELSRVLQTAFAIAQGYPLPTSLKAAASQPLPRPKVSKWSWIGFIGLLLTWIMGEVALQVNWLSIFSFSLGSILIGSLAYLFSLWRISISRSYNPTLGRMGYLGSWMAAVGALYFIPVRSRTDGMAIVFFIVIIALVFLLLANRRKSSKRQTEKRREAQR